MKASFKELICFYKYEIKYGTQTLKSMAELKNKLINIIK